ncbi:MAG: HEAT repeat domain-containing protein [Blastocatellia bacterium]|nr:HEAT repeat domain-containing protein [Blastocatellia bacterium]
MLWWHLRELRSTKWESRLKAAQKLGQAGDARGIEPLIEALTDPQPQVRYAADEALRRIDQNWMKTNSARNAVPGLIQLLASPEYEIRKTVMDILGLIRDKRALEPFIQALHDSEKEIRKNAADALGAFRDPRIFEPLKAALEDPEAPVRRSAALSLTQLNDKRTIGALVPKLTDESRLVREVVADCLQNLGWRPESDTELAAFAIAVRAWDQVGRMGIKAFEPLIHVLKDNDKEVQAAAAEALGKIGDQRAVEFLLPSLKHWDVEVRRLTAAALGRIPDARSVEPLQALAEKDTDGRVRAAAALALGTIGDQTAIDLLMGRLGDKDPEVRQAAAMSLGRLRNPYATQALVNALNDDYADVREAIALALEALRWKPRNEDEQALLIVSRKDWDGAAVCGAPAVEFLVKALTDRQNNVRMAAAYALGKIRDPLAVDRLISSLKHPEREVKRAAAEALGEIGDPRAVRPLLKLTGDLELATRAVSALRQVLENSPGQIESTDLRAIIALNNVNQVHQESDKKGDWADKWESKQAVNLSPVKNLATQELTRRGLHA